MIILNHRRFFTGLLAVLFLMVNVACSSNPKTETEAWEVMLEYPMHHFYSGPINQRIYQLSPDGKKLAYLKVTGDFINLVVADLASGKSQLVTNFNDAMVTGYTWANNKRLLFYMSDELSIYAVNYDGRNGDNWAYTTVVCKDECLAVPEPVFFLNYMQVIDRLPNEPDRVLVTSNHENTVQPDLYELNINTGKVFMVVPGKDSPTVYRWPTDGAGRVLQGTFDQRDVLSILEFNTITKQWSETPGERTAVELSPIELDNSSRLASLREKLKSDDIRFTSIDDERSLAVLMVSPSPKTVDYYLYEFADGSIRPLAGTPIEIELIEANPSRIRVELIVVNDRYQRRFTTDMATPIAAPRRFGNNMSGFDIAARAAAYRSIGRRN